MRDLHQHSLIVVPKISDVLSVVVSELKFRDVERQIFGADFVERADHPALEDALKALNRIGIAQRRQRTDVRCGQRSHAKIQSVRFASGRPVSCERDTLSETAFVMEVRTETPVEARPSTLGHNIALAQYGTDCRRLAAVVAFLFVPTQAQEETKCLSTKNRTGHAILLPGSAYRLD
jgi:hypothetical protein